MPSPSTRLGAPFGVELRLEWGAVAVGLLVGAALAASTLPGQLPGETPAAYWAAGMATAAALYGSVLAHELAHALAARRQGVEVAGVALGPFGGACRLAGRLPTARAQAVVMAAGPATNVAVACASLGAAAALAVAGAPVLAVYTASYVCVLNLALAAFNLVPAFPLDGGRLLAALLWSLSGSRHRGLAYAATASRALAALLLVASVAALFQGAVAAAIIGAGVALLFTVAAAAEESPSPARTSTSRAPHRPPGPVAHP